MAIDIVDEFLKRIEGYDSVILGNGFVLSHPVYNKIGKWDSNKALIINRDKILPPELNNNSPENDLGDIRINILESILKYYMGIFRQEFRLNDCSEIRGFYNEYIKNDYTCYRFLSKIKKLFTLNYDPLTYFEVLWIKNTYNIVFVDGFKGDEYIDQDSVCDRLNNEILRSKIYFLHGSWCILINSAGELRKLNFSKDSHDNIESVFRADDRPHIILEDRGSIKETLLKNNKDKYLNYCYDHLGEISGKLLIFGCSFETDHHLLKELFFNNNINELIITYFDANEEQQIKDKITSLKIDKKYDLIQVGGNVIWERKNQFSDEDLENH